MDLVVPTNVGIFVFEIKDYAGWIFGNANHQKWTQVLAYGDEKHQFYNPIKQNEGHITALRNTSEQLAHIPIYSFVVFYGSCSLRALHNIPQNCWVGHPRPIIKVLKDIIANTPPAPYTNKWEVISILKNAVANGCNEEIKDAHLRKVQTTCAGKYKTTYK